MDVGQLYIKYKELASLARKIKDIDAEISELKLKIVRLRERLATSMDMPMIYVSFESYVVDGDNKYSGTVIMRVAHPASTRKSLIIQVINGENEVYSKTINLDQIYPEDIEFLYGNKHLFKELVKILEDEKNRLMNEKRKLEETVNKLKTVKRLIENGK